MARPVAGGSPHPAAFWNALHFLRSLLQGRRMAYIVLCIGAGGLFTLSIVAAPLLIRRVIALIEAGSGTQAHIAPVVLAFIGLYLLRGLGRYAYGYFSHVVAYQVMHDIMTRTYQHLQTLSHRYFDEQRTGSLMARNVSDVEAVEDFVAHGIPEIALAVLGPLIMTVILVAVDPWLALLALAPLPLASWLIYRQRNRIRRYWRQVRAGLAEVAAQIQDNLSGITEIKLFNQERAQAAAIAQRSRQFRDASVAAMSVSMLPGSIVEMASGLGLVLIAWAGGTRAMAGELSLADLFLFVTYISFIYAPFLHIAETGDKLAKPLSAWNASANSCRKRPTFTIPRRLACSAPHPSRDPGPLNSWRWTSLTGPRRPRSGKCRFALIMDRRWPWWGRPARANLRSVV